VDSNHRSSLCKSAAFATRPRDRERILNSECRIQNEDMRIRSQFAFFNLHSEFSSIPGVGIEPTSSWFRARRHYQQQLPRSGIRRETISFRSVRGGRFERPSPDSKSGSLPLADPRVRAEGVRVELTRLIARLFSKQLPSPIGLPFRLASLLPAHGAYPCAVRGR
jgi:hypothetical protein